ncbi:MAG: 50S ribosome-binding GTPase [Candidatus Aenigmarchaeota archaeon]|nr:50S ribosome-binding GTPase [Candidatus Aenigmarchaeota archaeon]
MPINAGQEYFVAEKKYSDARTNEEKIKALEEMIRALPKHKGTHNVLADLKKRLSKLKKESAVSKRKSSKPSFIIRKEGSAQICIIGMTKSGKSSLLNSLTNAKAQVAEYPYTTKKPQVGMMYYKDIQFQMIEIPSTFNSEFMSLLYSCDLIVMMMDAMQNPMKQKEEILKILKKNKLDNKDMVFVKNKSKVCGLDPKEVCMDTKSGIGIDELKERMWEELKMIRIYTKSPNKPKAIPAIGMLKNSTVKDLTKEIHKDLLKDFKFAKIFNSTKYSGKKVGLEYKLQDNDVVEIHSE